MIIYQKGEVIENKLTGFSMGLPSNLQIHFGKAFQAYVAADGFFWFRIFGRGIKGKNVIKNPLLFSERIGKRKGIRIGNWHFSVLRKIEP